MGRIKGLVRAGTLQRHAQEGLVAGIEVVVFDDGVSLLVRYKESAEGQKTRYLTSLATAGPRKFAKIDTAWRFVAENLDIHRGVLRDATAEDLQDWKV